MANALTSEERKILLGIARNVIETYVRSGKIPLEKREEAALNVQQGCFVTIHRQGRLRGCIGVFTSRMPLWKQVTEMAIAASTRDPRFPAMTEEELADFSLEISVLSPLVKTADPNSVVVGTHGIYLENGLRRGVLLPQVATEYGWDRETFLKQTCRKAGLPTDAWQKPETTIYLFTAEVFGES